jgi:hypothetical protein
MNWLALSIFLCVVSVTVTLSLAGWFSDSPAAPEVKDGDEPCGDPIWCNVPMPSISYFKFDKPPSDPVRWKKAQLLASKGEQVLLKEIMKVFPNHFDFLDGDISFRKLHFTMDFFVDERRDMSPLVSSMRRKDGSANDDHRRKLELYDQGDFHNVLATKEDEHQRQQQLISWRNEQLAYQQEEEESISSLSTVSSDNRRSLEEANPMIPVITAPKMVGGKLQYPWELQGRRVIPDPYDFRGADRAPVIGVGYTAFRRDSQTYFSGDRVGGAFIDRSTFLNHWRSVKNRIDTPFIAICSLNENWGFLSTRFPNRTAGWGQCCSNNAKNLLIYDFLNHEKTLMFVTNQHTNVSHPKLLILPRGIPITWGLTRMLIWDTQRNSVKKTKKSILLFAASSKWGPRPQILRCISEKFKIEEFDGHSKATKPQVRLGRHEYYQKQTTAYFGLGLPGLGYDCFR